MALPICSGNVRSQSRVLAQQWARQREKEARCRQQWETHAHHLRTQNILSQRQVAWSSERSYRQSMTVYQRQKLMEEKKENLRQRRNKLRLTLEEEQKQLEVELKLVLSDRNILTSQLVQKTEELRSAREERRTKLAQELLKQHWKQNNHELREVESGLRKDRLVSCWQEQISEKREQEEAEQEEMRLLENEHESRRKEELERIKEVEEKKKAKVHQRAEDLCQQMEELRLREEEATRLAKVQEALTVQQWELEKIAEERRKSEERRKNSEMGHFLMRQYRAQLRRRAQQVQEELESDQKIMASLLEVKDDERMMETARKERAIADAAWMKRVIEEQLQLEREREADFDRLHREDAQRVWEKREAQWERERQAREQLVQEVLTGRQQQLQMKVQENRKAQEDSVKRREELIQKMEKERENRRWAREQDKSQKMARMQEINAQVEQQDQDRWEEQRWLEQEKEKEREARQIQEAELEQEKRFLAEEVYREKIISRPRSAWT